MDLDDLDELFNFNDDFLNEELEKHNSQQIDPIDDPQPEEHESTDIFFFLLNCTDENNATSSTESIFTKDLELLLKHARFVLPEEVELFNFRFDENLPVDILVRIGCQTIQKLATSTIDGNSKSCFFEQRESVTKLMLCLRSEYQDLSLNQLQLLRVCFAIFDWNSNSPTTSNTGNSNSSSSYHFFHGVLEWRWIYLTTLYKRDYINGLIGTDESDFNAELSLFIYDLLTLSLAKFNKKCTDANITFNSPFTCSCVKELWVALYRLVRETCQEKSFWSILSSLLSDIKCNKNPHERFESKKVLMRTSNFASVKNFDQFSIWFVCGLVKLVENNSADVSSSRESYELFESLVKSSLSVELSEEKLRVLLVIISEVLFEVWPPRSEVLMIFWEIFQRKINSPFLIAGQSPNLMPATSVSGAGYLQKIKAQQTSTGKLNLNLTSYDIFTHQLGKIVQRFTQDGQKIQIQKILSRIYTKFPASKLQTLNEMGIHNLLKLFITLSISTNFPDIAKKITETLLQIPMEKVNQQQQLMKGHVAMMILYRENKMNFSQYALKLMSQVNLLLDKSGNGFTSVLKIIADALPVIILQDSEDGEAFENGEEILLDTWIVKYLMSGTTAEQDRVYESLTKIIQKIRETRKTSLESSKLALLVQKLLKIFMPHCKQTFGKSESSWLPAMVANFCLLSLDYQHQTLSEIPKFEVLLKTFTELNYSNIENSIKFLTVVMENIEDVKQLDKLMIMQHWIKCSVLLTGNNSHLKDFTQCVMKIEEFKSLCETAKSHPEEFLNTKEPLCTFISDIGKKYATANNQMKFQLIEKVHSYFSNFEKWALPLLQLQQQQNSNQQRNQSSVSVDESVMRIYTFISITIMHCSELIYIRSKSACFFNVAISHFLLPSTLMMGQSQPRSIVVSIYKVWPLLIDGISKLDYKNDQHIAKVLTDIVVKWAPLLKISTNSKVVSKPFLSVVNLKNPEVIDFVFGKLGKSFIALQNRKPSPHACMILTIIEEVMHVIEGDEKKLMTVWKSLMAHVIEGAMMSDENLPSQMTCYNLLERFMKNKNFETSKDMQESLTTGMQNAIQVQLSFYSTPCFRFLTKIGKFSPKTITSILPFLMNQIKKCEQLRGSGLDMKLRNFYDQLQKSLIRK